MPAVQHLAAGFVVGLSGFAAEQFHIRCTVVVVDRGVDLIADALADKAAGGQEMGHRCVAGIYHHLERTAGEIAQLGPELASQSRFQAVQFYFQVAVGGVIGIAGKLYTAQ